MTQKEEKLKVKQLGKEIGYGNMMNIASELWKQDLREQGYPEDGAYIPVIQSQISTGYFSEDLNTSFTHTRPRPDTNPPSGRVTTKKTKNKNKKK